MMTYQQFKQFITERQLDTFTHEGDEYNLSELKRLIQDQPVEHIDIKRLTWIFRFDDPEKDHPERILTSHLSVPIIVLKSEPVVVLDGLHRIAKAKRNGLEKLPCRWVRLETLEKCKI